MYNDYDDYDDALIDNDVMVMTINDCFFKGVCQLVCYQETMTNASVPH